ncbi:MAG: hypothetical protein J5585_08845 [Clostridia bacterium]|nr:hypothetical protein [Clostridia bacterium]
MKKRILSALLAVLLTVGVMTSAVLAEEVPTVTGITLTEDGVLDWDEVSGNAQYWLGIDEGFVPTDRPADLKNSVTGAGIYEISVWAVDDNGDRIASVDFMVSTDGKKFVKDVKSVLAGWWGTSSNDHIKSVKVEGKDVSPSSGAFFEPGRQVKIEFQAKDGYEIVSAFLRYEDENRDSLTVTEKSAGVYECTATAPDAAWVIGVNTRGTLPSFNSHSADLGRRIEGVNVDTALYNIKIKTGKDPIPTENLYLKTEFTSGSSFQCDGLTSANLAEPYTCYNFYVYAKPDLTEGEYSGEITLYYDKDGGGSNWVEVDRCELTVRVVKPGQPVTATNWWCTSGDYVKSFELEETPFDSPVSLTPGAAVSAVVTVKEGLELRSVFLRYLEQNTAEGVTVIRHENNEYDVTFTVPDDDFAIGIDVAPDADYVRIDFDGNGAEGEMPSVYIRKGESYTLPSCTLTPPSGMELEGWRLLETETMSRYNHDYEGATVVIDRNTTLQAVWKEENTVQVMIDGGDGEGAMDSRYVKKGDFTLPESEFTPPDGRVFGGWRVEVYDGAAWTAVGVLAAGAKMTAEGETIFLHAEWVQPQTEAPVTDDTAADQTEQVTDGTTEQTGEPGTAAPDTTGADDTPGTEPDVTTGAESKGGKTALLIVAGIFIGMLICAGAGAAVLLILKKRASKKNAPKPEGENGPDKQ